jgi:hypothetical protein
MAVRDEPAPIPTEGRRFFLHRSQCSLQVQICECRGLNPSNLTSASDRLIKSAHTTRTQAGVVAGADRFAAIASSVEKPEVSVQRNHLDRQYYTRCLDTTTNMLDRESLHKGHALQRAAVMRALPESQQRITLSVDASNHHVCIVNIPRHKVLVEV